MQVEYLAIHAEMTSHHQEGDGLGRTAAARSSTQQQRRLIHPGETPCGILKRQLLPILNVHIGCPKLDRHSADTHQLIATQPTSASSAKCVLFDGGRLAISALVGLTPEQ